MADEKEPKDDSGSESDDETAVKMVLRARRAASDAGSSDDEVAAGAEDAGDEAAGDDDAEGADEEGENAAEEGGDEEGEEEGEDEAAAGEEAKAKERERDDNMAPRSGPYWEHDDRSEMVDPREPRAFGEEDIPRCARCFLQRVSIALAALRMLTEWLFLRGFTKLVTGCPTLYIRLSSATLSSQWCVQAEAL